MARRRSTTEREQAVYRGLDGNVCGQRSGDLFIRRCHSRHFLRTPPAVSIDASVCEQVYRECRTIRVVNLDTDETYTISVDEFRARAQPLDRGFGLQHMVPLRYFQTGSHNPRPTEPEQLPLASSPPAAEEQPRQLKLFDL